MKIISRSLLAVFLIFAAENVMAVEEAEYTVSVKQDNLEIRDYAPSIVAEVIVYGEFEDASSDAFRTLFNYISGKNTAQSKIAMTAPVSQKAEPEKIAMTAPVGQRKSGQGWAVSFMMPASYTMDTIPVPDDSSVVLREIPAYRAAAIRYSGFWSEKVYKKQLFILQEWIKSKNLEPIGEPVWARYNAPLTPWFMRRNEILIPLAP
jgi:hypothetical protein